MSNEANGTNTDKEKGPSAIAKATKAWRDKGAKLPDEKTRKVLFSTFKELLSERDKAQKALDAASAKLNTHATEMVAAFGDKKLDIGGRIFFPASRGETLFYREQGKQDPDDIIKG